MGKYYTITFTEVKIESYLEIFFQSAIQLSILKRKNEEEKENQIIIYKTQNVNNDEEDSLILQSEAQAYGVSDDEARDG